MLTPIPFSVDSPAPRALMASLDEFPSARVHNPVDYHTRTPMPNITPTPNPTQEMGHQLAEMTASFHACSHITQLLPVLQPHKL